MKLQSMMILLGLGIDIENKHYDYSWKLHAELSELTE